MGYFKYDEETNQGRLFVTLENCCSDMLSDVLDYETQDFNGHSEAEVRSLAMQHFLRAIEALKGDLQ